MKANDQNKKNLASACGLFCGACAVYYSTQENNIEKLKTITAKFGLSLDDAYCDGCRSERKSGYCKECALLKCALDKDVEFCGECEQYPCKELVDFQSKMPHRKNLWNSQNRIKKVGWEQWLSEMELYYSCPSCETMNGAYDMSCRKCGHAPGNQFVKDFME